MAAATASYVYYDYKTCHPMRKMKGYNVDGAVIRFHNTLIRQNILPTSTMSLQDLSKFDGRGTGSGSGGENHNKNSTKIYFASDGWIWDVTKSESFQNNNNQNQDKNKNDAADSSSSSSSPYGMWCGKDATVSLGKMSMKKLDINRTDYENLTSQDLESIKSWTNYFSEKYYIKGKLKEYTDYKQQQQQKQNQEKQKKKQ